MNNNLNLLAEQSEYRIFLNFYNVFSSFHIDLSHLQLHLVAILSNIYLFYTFIENNSFIFISLSNI